MTDSLNMGKRAFTTAVAAATILWSIGISSFVAPMTAHAASAGSVIKGTTLSTLYFYGSDGSRYAFPNEKTYFSWYPDYSSVSTISDAALAAIPLAGNVTYRAGSRWIKIQSDPKTYVVTPEGQVRWIESESVASGLAGSDWNTMIDDVADTFFVDYTVGTSLTSAAAAFNGAYVSMGGSMYLVDGSEKRMVTSAGASANWLQSRNLLDGTGVTLSSLSAGSELSSADAELTDVAQLGTSVTGGLSVSLASDTPASATIPNGASSVGFTKVKLMASSGSADVSQMVFHLGGIGDIDNIVDAFLYQGSVRLTDGRSVNSSRDVTFSGLDLSLASGASTYVTVKANILEAGIGGDTANFSLASASSVTSTATVSGSFPITGSTMTFSDTPAGTIFVEDWTDPSDVTIGEKGAEIAEFDVRADVEDASLEEITVNVDSASDHSNYTLSAGSDELATGTVSDDLVTFVLTNSLFIEEGESETLTVSADIGGEATDTIVTLVEETTDVVAMGGDYGFNLQVDLEAGDSTVAIEGGDLTFANNGPSADDIAVDGNDVVLLEFSLTASNWTEVKELVVNFVSDEENVGLIDGDAMLEDLAIRESDGSVWMGSEELSTVDEGDNDTIQVITFDDNQMLQAGESLDLMVTVDVSADATADEVYHAELVMGGVVAEDANGDDLTDVVPSADIVGKDMTVTDSSLEVSASTPPSDGTYVKGSMGVSVAGFNFEAGDAMDVMITDLVVAITGSDEDGDPDAVDFGDVNVGDYVSQCSLYDNESGSLVDGPESPTDDTDLDEDLEFENFEWTVEAGETSKLIVKCDFSNTDVTGGDPDVYAFGIATEDDVTAEDADGDDVTAGGFAALNTDGAETSVTITDVGTLTVSLDGSSANSTIILGGSTAVAMSKFKFEADDEAFVIKHLELENDGDDEGVSVVKISYTNSAGATETKSGYLSGNVVSFDGMDMYVASDSSATLTVTIDTGSVTLAEMSGDQIQLNLESDLEFEAIGEDSGVTIDEITDEEGNQMILRKTKPTLSLASGSPSGAGVAGDSEVFRFNVAADSRGEVTLNQVTFKIVTSEDGSAFNACDTFADPTKFTFYDTDDSSEKLDEDVDWTFIDDTDASCEDDGLDMDVLSYAVLALSEAELIGAGETKTYVLKIDTLGASSSDDDAIRVEIPDQDEADDVDGGTDAINWGDDEALSIDGDLIKSLPVTGGTIQY